MAVVYRVVAVADELGLCMFVTCLCLSLQALMYQDPDRWGITLQTYVQLTMLDSHLSSIVCVMVARHTHFYCELANTDCINL